MFPQIVTADADRVHVRIVRGGLEVAIQRFHRALDVAHALLHDGDVAKDLGAQRQLVRLLELAKRCLVLGLFEVRGARLEVSACEFVGIGLSETRGRSGQRQGDSDYDGEQRVRSASGAGEHGGHQ
jgi:hypothetical protein